MHERLLLDIDDKLIVNERIKKKKKRKKYLYENEDVADI